MDRERTEDFVKANALRTLQNHVAVRNVAYREKVPISNMDIAEWEKTNAPYVLPDDYKAFLLAMNGFELSWQMVQRLGMPMDNAVFGLMHLNSLESVSRIADEDSPEHPAFDLDYKCECGQVCLRYTSPTDCKIWLRDSCGEWSFIAATFNDYYRLLLAHLGIPRWQLIFTRHGLDRSSAFWVLWLTDRQVTRAEMAYM